MDLAVGEDRCAIWSCEDETLCESVHEKTSCGEFACEDMSFPLAVVVDHDRANSGLGKRFPRSEDGDERRRSVRLIPPWAAAQVQLSSVKPSQWRGREGQRGREDPSC